MKHHFINNGVFLCLFVSLKDKMTLNSIITGQIDLFYAYDLLGILFDVLL
jgi:hypothetical protein